MCGTTVRRPSLSYTVTMPQSTPPLDCQTTTEHYSLVYCRFIEPDENAFLVCDRVSKRLRQVTCSSVNGVPMEFDGKSGCVEPMERRYKRQAARSGRVGDACNFNTDCLTGMYCSTGACACLSNYVAISGYCYISPFSPSLSLRILTSSSTLYTFRDQSWR